MEKVKVQKQSGNKSSMNLSSKSPCLSLRRSKVMILP